MAMNVFDLLEDEEMSIFDSIESEDSAVDILKSQLTDVLAQFDDKERRKQHATLKADFEKTLKSEIAKIKPIQQVIERQIEQIIKHEQVPIHLEPKIYHTPAPLPQIIKEIRVEVQQERKDDRKYAEEKTVENLKSEIQSLKDQLEMVRQSLPFLGGAGVIGLPIPDGNNGKTLQVVNNQWKPVTATSGGGTSSDAYTPTNVTTDRSFDADSTSIDELADVLGSLISSLQGAGIIQ